MCGIVGILANRPATPIVLDALRRLEYRGYDSAGVAAVANGALSRRRACGKIASLYDLLELEPLDGFSAIGHTRWATHGGPTVKNAHPHVSGPVAVVHNGIIENYLELREELSSRGWTFESDTDTEVIATLCHDMLCQGLDFADAAAAALSRLRGAYAVCFLFEGADDLLVCARRGSPLVIGFGKEESFVGSDAIALAPLTDQIAYLEEGDRAILTRHSVQIYDAAGNPVDRQIHTCTLDTLIVDKGPFRHFMAKEIHEQPSVIARALGKWMAPDRQHIQSAASPINWAAVPRLTIVACGTAYLAGHMAKVWFESIARLPVEIEIASEFRYREPPMPEHGVTLVISQSGETADTLAALRFAKEQGQQTIALINVETSTIAREADIALSIHAGPEIGVASTKAFTAQMLCLSALCVQVARQRGAISDTQETDFVALLSTIPRLVAEVIALESDFKAVAADISQAQSVLYLGRGPSYPLALEGALKLKEITYIHAEGYAAGELKHGPIALVDENTPIIVLAPHDALFDKSASNIREVLARNGRVILLTDQEGRRQMKDAALRCVCVPSAGPFVAPFLQAVAVQMIAYHAAVARGTDVDQPRNLAKSVTVE